MHKLSSFSILLQIICQFFTTLHGKLCHLKTAVHLCRRSIVLIQDFVACCFFVCNPFSLLSENLIELKRKDENNMNKNKIISIIYTVTMIIGILVCCICDVAISGTLTWSLITLSSILITWIASFPVVLLGKKVFW